MPTCRRYNINAAFELGVRYGLRPHATIVVAEEGFKPAFDVTHMVIRRYKHLGEDIGRDEAKRFQEVLRSLIDPILTAAKVDSPVYSFLTDLDPPRPRVAQGGTDDAPSGTGDGGDAVSDKSLLDGAMQAMRGGDFAVAIRELQALHGRRPNDRHVVHQLALATYKSEQPSARAALLAAREILLAIAPHTTNDPETLGLWGSVHKRLWALDHDPAALAQSIEAYSRGFYVKQDHYNGVNFATLLETRALHEARTGAREEAIADRVLARRVREEVVRMLLPRLVDLHECEPAQQYWVLASLSEAHAALGNEAEAAAWQQRATATGPHDWMLESTTGQIADNRKMQSELAAALAAA